MKQELLEVSLVVVPANPGATIGAALKSGATTKEHVQNVWEFLREFCGEEAGSGTLAGASGSRAIDAQLLQLARSLNSVFKGH